MMIPAKNRRRVLFLLPSLSGGGAERVITVLLRKLDRARLDLHLGLVSADGAYRHLIPAGIPVYDLRTKHVRFSLLRLLRQLPRAAPRQLGQQRKMLSYTSPTLRCTAV
ncbi:MAG: glycosyltransferase [Fuerstiella sp.]|nr:glycosyltransferase [Fuerstiella sp.]